MKQQEWNHTVKRIKSKIRIVDYCGDVFPILGSKSATKKAIYNQQLFINGTVATTANFIKSGDQIKLKFKSKTIKKFNLDIKIVYEDDHLLVAHKPGGIAVNGNRYKTVENVFADRTRNNQQPGALNRPLAVHRIDVPTKGLVILAKTKPAQINLSKAFQNNQVKKTYIAIVHGKTPPRGTYNRPIDGKGARTTFKTLRTVSSKNFSHLSLLELQPVTGRTHQLRIHCQQAGHLILGDKEYANDQKTILGKGLFLVAQKLVFAHPITAEMLILKVPTPNRFERILDRESRRFEGH